MAFTKKQIICVVIIAAALVLSLLAPIFTLMTAEVSLLGYKTSNDCSGYSALFEGSYPKGMSDVGDWVIVFTIIQLVATLIMAVAAIYTIAGKKDEKAISKVALGVSIATFILSLVYMINGFMCVSAMEESLDGYGTVETSAFYPIIIAVVLVVANIVATKLPAGALAAMAPATAGRGATGETQAIEALLRYKALLDSGVITQEEFEAKKALLLGGAAASAPSYTSAPTPAPEASSATELPAYVDVDCPLCQKKMRIPSSLLGKEVKCPHCQEVIIVNL